MQRTDHGLYLDRSPDRRSATGTALTCHVGRHHGDTQAYCQQSDNSLLKARIRNYRSIIDTGWFEIDERKTIFVGPNEAGKTAVLVALASLKPGIERRFDPLREFPRHLYQRFENGELPANQTPIVTGVFEINKEVRQQLAQVSSDYAVAKTVKVTRYWDWTRKFSIDSGWPQAPTWSTIRAGVATLAAALPPDQTELKSTQQNLATTFASNTPLSDESIRQQVVPWLDRVEGIAGGENEHLRTIRTALEWNNTSELAINLLDAALPKFVYYDNYWRAHARIHLAAFNTRLAQKQTEDYDFADKCLLEYVGLDVNELLQLGLLGQVANQPYAQKESHLDKRFIKLNAAAIELTSAIKNSWGDELYRLRFTVDGDYLRVLAVDEQGVELEISEKSLAGR